MSCADWSRPPGYLACSKLDPLPASVPGHVHLDLVRNGVVGDPFAAKQELGCQWVDHAEWNYCVEFVVEEGPQLPHRRLRFGGLDTVCRIRLNDELIAEHDNMFVPLEVDVGERLRIGSNRLEVSFSSAVDVGNRRRAAYFQREDLPPDLVRFDERAFVRKAPYMFGWDWGPRLVSAGIWQPVELVEFAARLQDVRVEQWHQPDGDVVVRVTSVVEGDGSVVHFWRESPGDPWCRLEEGEALRLRTPKLWWPAGAGEPFLHELVTFLLPPGLSCNTEPECRAGALDVRTSRVGLRTIRLRQEPDAWGTSFGFEVNGRPIWCLGANWIPDHSFPSQVTRDRLRRQLRSARDMNMNMLRVWGGGIYETDDFYDLCDELGILVWQDFPFACSYAPDDAASVAELENEAEFAVKRLRNRASLALWCGNNENLMMFEAKWDDATKHPTRCHGERIWNSALPALLARLDPDRPYVATSPHSPGGGEPANSDACGDQHNWDVWHGRGDWVHYRESRARFASEYGFASAPSRASWRRALGTDALHTVDVRHPVVQWHDKTKKGYETFLAFAELHYARASNLEAWTYYSQLNQRDALSAAVEHYRSSAFCRGSLIWQLNDCWPVQSWSVMDDTGTLKAAGIALRRLYAPAIATVDWVSQGDDRTARFTSAWDNRAEPFEGTLRVELRDSRDGALTRRVERTVRLAPGERRQVMDFDVGDVDPTSVILWFDFAGHTAYRLLCEPKQLRCSEPTWSARLEGRELVLAASAPVLDLWVLPENGDALDNFMCLREPGTVRVNLTHPCSTVNLRWLDGRATLRLPDSTNPG